MSLALCDFLIRHFEHGKPEPTADILAKWIPILQQFGEAYGLDMGLYGLLTKCIDDKCWGPALLLFDRATQLRVRLRQAFPMPGSRDAETPQVEWEIATGLQRHQFRETWESVLKPRMSIAADRIAAIALGRLEQAHEMLSSVGKADRNWDPISFSRSAIETHGQNHNTEGVGALIELARNALEWIVENRPDRSSVLISSLIPSGVPLLRRLAVHCVAHSLALDADGKIDWLLDNNLLYAYCEKHEVYRVLQESFPLASEECRRRLLDAVASGPPRAEDDSGHRAYMIYSLAGWLRQAAPSCALAEGLFDKLQEEHPDFQVRDHPDLDHYITRGGTARPDPREITVEGILAHDPDTETDWFLSFAGRAASGEHWRQSFVHMVSLAVARDEQWGWRLARSLQRTSSWDTLLWGGILPPLTASAKTRRQWRALLLLVEDVGGLLVDVTPALRVLRAVASKTEDMHLPMSLLLRAESAFVSIWPKARDLEAPVAHEDGTWFFAIEDHAGGVAAQFWVLALWQHVRKHSINKGIPARYRRALQRIFSDESASARAGCPMLAHYIRFFYALDALWTVRYVLPLLDWTIDESRAEKAWQCYLNNSGVNTDACRATASLYRQTFAHVREKLSIFRESFTDHIAFLSADASFDPLADNWLVDFLNAAEPDDKVRWAWSLRSQLESLNSEAIKDIWSRWLDSYWAKRIDGIPLPLGPDEQREMMSWLPCLHPVFPAAVRRFCQGPPLQNSSLYNLERIDWLGEYPQSLADLLLFLLTHADTRQFYDCEDAFRLFKIAAEGGADNTTLRNVGNALCRLGCRSAQDLEEFLA